MTGPRTTRPETGPWAAGAGHEQRSRGPVLPLLMLLLALQSPATAADSLANRASKSNAGSAGALDVPRHVIASGGGRSAGAAWVIRGTVGQVDAEPLQPSTDGTGFYAITGGFWPALPAPQIDWLFADGMEARSD